MNWLLLVRKIPPEVNFPPSTERISLADGKTTIILPFLMGGYSLFPCKKFQTLEFFIWLRNLKQFSHIYRKNSTFSHGVIKKPFPWKKILEIGIFHNFYLALKSWTIMSLLITHVYRGSPLTTVSPSTIPGLVWFSNSTLIEIH